MLVFEKVTIYLEIRNCNPTLSMLLSRFHREEIKVATLLLKTQVKERGFVLIHCSKNGRGFAFGQFILDQVFGIDKVEVMPGWVNKAIDT